MSRESLQKAIGLVGSQSELARRIREFKPSSKVSQAHVAKWLNRLVGDTPPPEHVIPIAFATGWEVSPHQLRPDIYPNPNDGLPADEREAA